jgi:hypothetical protein
MAVTAKGFPYPVAADGRPHIDQAIAALAARVEAVLAILSDAEIAALAGVDLWNGRLAIQSNTGSTRLWRGLYEYDGSAWRSLVSLGPMAAFTPAVTAVTTAPSLGTSTPKRGAYVTMGGLCIGNATVQQGLSGPWSAGSGTWLVSLPIAAAYATNNKAIGSGQWNRGTAPYSSAIASCELVLVDSTHAKLVWTNGTGDLGSASVPFNTASATGLLSYSFAYRVAA